jgi:hypothetical protein
MKHREVPGMQLSFKPLVTMTILLLISGATTAFDFEAQMGLEGRFFPAEGFYGQQQTNLSGWFKPKVYQEFNDGDDQLHLQGYFRYDVNDNERTHGDIREAYWLHIGDYLDTQIGIGKVFWGVTESQHLVDIINQTDLVENPDGEEKLGQPMFLLSTAQGNVLLDVFVLPYFRERTFAGEDGRLVTPFPVRDSDALYESGAEEKHIDYAVRWALIGDGFEFSLSHFNGTSREPLLTFNGSTSNPELVPFYPQIEQTGLVSQFIYEGWLWKFEGIVRSGFGDRYGAVTTGFEYTQGAAFGTDADLGWIVEALWDERGDEATSFTEQDVFLGWRWAANDIESTEILFGVIADIESGEQVYGLEASRRWREIFTVNFELRAFEGGEALPDKSAERLQILANPDAENKTGFLQTEDYIQIEVTYYF